MAGAGRRRARWSRARVAAALVVAALAFAAGALQGAEARRGRKRRGFKVVGVVAARACSWIPDPEGGGGALELTGVEVSQIFTVAPKRRAANATLEELVQAFTAPRKPRNVALTAWPSTEAGTGAAPPRYLVGQLLGAEVQASGTTPDTTGLRPPLSESSGLRLRLQMSAAQAQASAPENLPSPAPGFQAANCSLFLDSCTVSTMG